MDIMRGDIPIFLNQEEDWIKTLEITEVQVMGESPIPKIIHYCWFGGNPKSELILRCISSWKKYMPEYEIKEWNEQNYDVNKADFIREAYEAKKWAFVSDFARFDVINQYGGIYFDTDVELLKPIPHEILRHHSFTGFEYAGSVNPGLVYADVPGGAVTKSILSKYNSMHFCKDKNGNYITVNMVVTDILETDGLKRNNSFQIVNDLAIYPSSVFCGFDQDVKEIAIQGDTISVHHYAGTWIKKTKKQMIRNYLKKLFGVEGYRKILKFYRKVRKNHGTD